MSHVEAESTTNQTNKSSRAGHVFLLLPEIPLAAVHEISSPNRSPTNPARSRAVGEDRSAVPIIPFPPTKLFTCSPSRRAEKQKKKNDSPLLCSPGTSAAVDGFRKDQIRRRHHRCRSTDARSDFQPVRSALLGARHAVVPEALGQRLQITVSERYAH